MRRHTRIAIAPIEIARKTGKVARSVLIVMAVLPAQMLPMGGVGGSMGIFGRGAKVLADVRVWQRRAASARAPIAARLATLVQARIGRRVTGVDKGHI